MSPCAARHWALVTSHCEQAHRYCCLRLTSPVALLSASFSLTRGCSLPCRPPPLSLSPANQPVSVLEHAVSHIPLHHWLTLDCRCRHFRFWLLLGALVAGENVTRLWEEHVLFDGRKGYCPFRRQRALHSSDNIWENYSVWFPRATLMYVEFPIISGVNTVTLRSEREKTLWRAKWHLWYHNAQDMQWQINLSLALSVSLSFSFYFSLSLIQDTSLIAGVLFQEVASLLQILDHLEWTSTA